MSEQPNLAERQYSVGLPVGVTVRDDGWVSIKVDLSELATAVTKDWFAGPLGDEWEGIDTDEITVEDSEVLRRWVFTHEVSNEDFVRIKEEHDVDSGTPTT